MGRLIGLIILSFPLLFAISCGEDGDSPITPTVSVSGGSITEEDSDVTLTVDINLSQASTSDISVEVSTIERTATAEDFTPVNTILRIDAGSTSASVDITIIGDDLVEDDETFQVVLSDPFNATLGVEAATFTIRNDDLHEFSIPATGFESPTTYDGMTLVWEEDFNGESIDTETWSFEIGDGCAQGICGWGNEELQFYQEENASIVDGNLVIEARQQSRGGKAYTSSRMITKDKVTFQYGRIDIRAVMPSTQSMWPALWMLGADIDEVGWPSCGEIDIMEMVGGGEDDAITHGTVHWDNNGSYANFGGSTKLSSGKLSDEYHVYSIIWDEEKILWLFDDVQYHAIDITPEGLSEFQNEFFMILNIAVGGNWPGSPDETTLFPNWMIVDYIRYFQEEQ